MATKYRRLQATRPKPAKRTWKKSLTIQGQAPSLKDVFSQHANGFPLPMARQEIHLGLELNDFLEDQYDIPNPEKIQSMDRNEKQQLMENLRSLQSTLNTKLETAVTHVQSVQEPEPTPAPAPDPV